MKKQRVVAVFDFDGTLTTKDTLAEFIKFVKGSQAYYWGLVLCSPILLAYLLKLIPNDQAKQYLFSHFFKGMTYHEFERFGKKFSQRVDEIVRKETFNKLALHKESGHLLYVVSASIEEWVKPWCLQNDIDVVLGTQVEVTNGVLTGRFSSKNCYGAEKVSRFIQLEPHRKQYYLYAYGDSSGDKEMLALADKATWVK